MGMTMVQKILAKATGQAFVKVNNVVELGQPGHVPRERRAGDMIQNETPLPM